MSYTRYAIYYLPPEGALASFGAAWLGWDCVAGREVVQPDVPLMERITRKPRKYGFHGTLKPPFRLADGMEVDELKSAVDLMAQTCAPAQSNGLRLTCLGRFLALTAIGDTQGIARVAATCVEALDHFRAPLTEADLVQRRKARLTDQQDALLRRWGYPFVMEEFRFHLTLTGRLPVDQIEAWTQTAQAYLPSLPEPFVLEEVALVGERPDGRFELIERVPLAG